MSYFSNKGTQLYYEIHGEGEPLLIIPGGGADGRYYLPIVEILKNSFRVILPDPRGCGRSKKGSQSYTFDLLASDIVALLNHLKIETSHVIGHSMGGMVAQEMVARAPERVKQLVLYGTGATGVLPGRFETIETSKRRALADGPQVTARRIAATWVLEREKADGYQDCARIAERCRLAAMLNGLDAMEHWSGVEQLAEIGIRTLVLWGDCERTYNWSQTEQLWQSIARANLSVMPGCAHAVHLEKPGLFNSVLGDFLQSDGA